MRTSEEAPAEASAEEAGPLRPGYLDCTQADRDGNICIAQRFARGGILQVSHYGESCSESRSSRRSERRHGDALQNTSVFVEATRAQSSDGTPGRRHAWRRPDGRSWVLERSKGESEPAGRGVALLFLLGVVVRFRDIQRRHTVEAVTDDLLDPRSQDLFDEIALTVRENKHLRSSYHDEAREISREGCSA